MKLKITTLTPVHISTGNLNPCYLYHKNNNSFHCYDIQDIFTFVSPDELMNLNFLSSNDRSKKYIQNFFEKHVNYTQLSSKYTLESHLDSFTCDVKEQVKSLNKPYIPGSSLKGALMNIVVFFILEKRKNECKEFLKKFDKKNSRNFEKELMSELFDYHFDDIFKIFSSCIICRDIFFEKMVLCEAERLNMNDNNPTFFHMECIANSQTVEDEFIVIDQVRINMLKEAIGEIQNDKIRKKYHILLQFLNIENILFAMRVYFKHVIKEDEEYFSNVIEDESSDDILEFINQLDIHDKTTSFLRIGNSTNYFYKSISLFIKKLDKHFYETNFDLFSPVNLRGKGRKPTADSMPKTRTVVFSNGYYDLAGIVQIEKCI